MTTSLRRAAHPMSLKGKKDAAHKYAAHKRYQAAYNAGEWTYKNPSRGEAARMNGISE